MSKTDTVAVLSAAVIGASLTALFLAAGLLYALIVEFLRSRKGLDSGIGQP